MMTEKSGFLLGIGSNINPNENMPKIINALLLHFPDLSISRILKLPPIGMNSQQDFLNVVGFIETTMPEKALKTICNQIEITLGRDRDDPASKMKDRPADIDILTATSFPTDNLRSMASITDEYFLYPLIAELRAFITHQPFKPLQAGTTVQLDNLTFGQTATTIYRQTDTSNKRII
jgi:2-amino-4-hydroxy-6-hydroxymethyldihydropteridine diphosphokinase